MPFALRALCLATFVATVSLSAVSPLLAQGAVEGPLPQLSGNAASGDTAAPATPRGKSPGKVLDNDAVIRMTKAGLDESILLQTVRSQPGDYGTGPDDLIALKDAGVSQSVIAALLAHNSGLQQHPAPAPIEVAPLSVNTDDPGVYFKNRQGQWEAVGPELVRYRDGGALKSLATNNIIKKDENGVVTGPRSKLSVAPGTEMMILAPNLQADAVEYVILRFRDKGDRREFRVKTGNVFHSETGTDRDALEIPVQKVSSRLFAFTVPHDLKKGEYGVLAPGSAATPGISHAGKIYTFSITE